jgi:Xaa-Pro aminopeptidase
LPFAAYEGLLASKATLDPRGDITALPKACKNETELSRARDAHLIDAIAMCKFLCWLNSQTAGILTEIDIVIELESFRSANPELYDISFETICASGPNAALPHYRVNNDSNRTIKNGEVILIDSGGQYKSGTTDITRTTALGQVSSEIKQAFTLVLKGMISISKLRFPKGMAGCDLDAFARVFLWSRGLDFAHGTGHGVGQFLSVHEGPQRLSRTSNVPFEAGMIISNEPGFYKEGHFGIRIENLLTVTKAPKLEHSVVAEMFIFETLNFVPIDKNLIEKDLMSTDEIVWLNEYHSQCREKIRAHLDENERIWLDHATNKL